MQKNLQVSSSEIASSKGNSICYCRRIAKLLPLVVGPDQSLPTIWGRT